MKGTSLQSKAPGWSRSIAAWATIAFATVIGGCERPEPKFAPPPPPEVTVARPIVREIEETMEFAARTRGVEEVEVRARVRGFLAKKLSDGGSRVKAGDLLFEIDPREYQAAVDSAEAQVAAANADLTIAELTLSRAKEAMAAQAATQQEVDQKQALRDSAKANVAIAEAQLAKANLDLEFTQVRAPIDGRMSIVALDVGQLVGVGDATLLATIINDAKIYADFEIDERTVLALRERHQNRRPGEEGRANLPLRLRLPGSEEFKHVGVFSRGDNAVDTQTGTIRVEGIFDNPDGTILPGLFARVQAVFGMRQAMLVPDVAVLADQIGRFVYVVGAGDRIERRSVVVGDRHGRMRRIDSGLTSEDRVVVNGVQRVRVDMPVVPKEAPAPTPVPTPVPTPAPRPDQAPDQAPAQAPDQSPSKT
jgi:RND family efflux transporter MFP subunit